MKDKKPTDYKADFKRRLAEIKRTRWVRFSLVALLYLAWVAWLGNWWWALGLILIFDIYITGYIPFTWWKQSKSKATRSVMSWVDAIIYALILVYFIFGFLGQNYMIPSSSLEKTLLTGDYLVVNKVTYGPRVPITPVHVPLVHNKLPILNCDSYLDWPQNSYHRLKGLRSVENGDIVVFNFPAGDTVATKYEETANYYDLVRAYGWERVNNDPATFGEVRYRPVDRRTNYVKRAVGIAGQNLRISNDTIYIDGVAQPFPEHVQFRYYFTSPYAITTEMAYKYGIAPEDIANESKEQAMRFARHLGFDPNLILYSAPLIYDMVEQMKRDGLITNIVKANDIFTIGNGEMYPEGLGRDWSTSNWGGPDGVVIPAKGMTVELDAEAWDLYKRCIRNYEGHHDAYFTDGVAYIDGKPAKEYTFTMDYYFMMGDNRDNSLDSRFWGFVPEDHVVGTPLFVVISFDKDRSIFNGGIRWNRVFTSANPDKPAFEVAQNP
ncbi:MAG: signal peptidase I [Bacteroidales bacterium]|nr:signal peptidase I [Bacteroidales bacterium]